MSTFQGGYSSAYEGIASYRSYLDLSMDDIEFSTGLKNPLYFSEESVHKSQYDHKTMNPPAFGGYAKGNGNYNLIKSNINITRFGEFIKLYKLQDYIDSHKASTIFVPINDNMKDLFSIVQTSSLTPKDIINFHTLDYILTPFELYNRNLRIQPLLLGQTFITKNTSIINEHDDRTPNNILQSIKTDSGYLYLIEKPLIPYVY